MTRTVKAGVARSWKAFAERKDASMTKLADPTSHDRSLKGAVDNGVLPLVMAINANPNYFTTSSCSGRLFVFHKTDITAGLRPSTGVPLSARKKRGDGVGAVTSSHDPLTPAGMDSVLSAIDAHMAAGDFASGTVEMKWDPMLIHAECRSLAAAEELLRAGVGAGFRLSGVRPTRRIMCSIGGAFGFAAPIVLNGEPAYTPQGIRLLMERANVLFRENESRKERLLHSIRQLE